MSEALPDGFKMTELGPLPAEWGIVSFEDAVIKHRIKIGKVEQRDYRESGKYPIVDQGQDKVGGFWDEDDDVYHGELPVIVFGDHTRVFKYVDFPFVQGADGTKILLPKKRDFDPRFLYYALRTLNIPSKGYNRHFKFLREKSIIRPPLSEQKRIALVLYTVEVAEKKTEDVTTGAEELKRSLMKHLFTYGPVPVEEVEKVELKETEIGPIPAHWDVKQIGEIASEVRSGITPRGGRKVYLKSGIPFIRSQNVQMNSLLLTDIVYISSETHQSMSRSAIRPNDVLLNITGASIGRVTCVPVSMKTANVNQHVCRLRIAGEVSPLFVSYYLASSRGQMQIMGSQYGTTRQGLNFGQVRMLRIPLPTEAEQNEMARMLQATDHKIQTCRNKKRALKELFGTLLNNLMTAKTRVDGAGIGT